MPQSNRKYPSGAPKRRKKKGRIKAYKKCKGVLDIFVIVAGSGLLVSLHRRVQLQVPKLLIAAMSA